MILYSNLFFRIRVVALILAFFVLCFFVGFLRNAFSYVDSNSNKWAVHIDKVEWINVFLSPIFYVYYPDTPSPPQFRSTGQLIKTSGYEINFTWYKCNDGWWQPVSSHSSRRSVYTQIEQAISTYSNGQFTPSDGAVWDERNTITCEPPEPCQTQKDNLISKCGGDENVDWDTWNDSTCTGECKLSINANLGSTKPDQCPIP